MEPTFRASMNWLHTWTGVVVGALLFAIFWMGTLSVFDREIDRWMMPMTRLAKPDAIASFDALRHSLENTEAAHAQFWTVLLPTERQPVIRLTYRDASGFIPRLLDPASGALLPDSGTWAGTRFLYPLHYHLHLHAWDIGLWLVGFSGMAMLVLCVSGVIVHRKIFADFFAFRIQKKPRRAILDLHNLTGVLALPFHIAISLSGLIVLYAIYFPSGWQVAYADRATFHQEAFGAYSRPKVNEPGQLASLDAMAHEARRLWDGDELRSLSVWHPGDAASYVQIGRSFEDGVTLDADVASFDGTTGVLLHRRTEPRLVKTAQRFITGLHLIQFRHWTLRWLYFVLGLSGCVLIATGYLFWLETRRKRHTQLGLRGARIVEGLAIGSVSGIVVATLTFFVVNRLLPLGATFQGIERYALEIWAFYLAWLVTFLHAWLRPVQAWVEQCWTIAALAVAAVLLNWITTGDHLAHSLGQRHLWAIAGMDLMLFAGASVAAVTAVRLQRRPMVSQAAALPEKRHA